MLKTWHTRVCRKIPQRLPSGRLCLITPYHDVHICMRTDGHSITTPSTGSVMVKFELNFLREEVVPGRTVTKPRSGPKFPKISVLFCVSSCAALFQCDSRIFDREYRALLTFGGGCLRLWDHPVKSLFRGSSFSEVLHLPQKFAVSPSMSLSICVRCVGERKRTGKSKGVEGSEREFRN